MPATPDTKDSPAGTGTLAHGQLGGHIPNLVLIQDSEKGAEFRIQCEVPLTEGEANQVHADLLPSTRSKESLERIKVLVLSRVLSGASDTFRDIVKRSFEDQPEYDQKSQEYGAHIPNLLLIQDSEKGAEFRIQCEVPLTEAEANQVHEGLLQSTRTRESRERVKGLVLSRMLPGASSTFRDIVKRSFEDQPESDQNWRGR